MTTTAPIRALSWFDLCRIEFTKLIDTRGIKIALVATIVVSVVAAWGIVELLTSSLFEAPDVSFSLLTGTLTIPASLAALWISITGATADWQHNTATSQFPLIRSRLQHFTARIIATLVLTLLITAASLVLCIVVFQLSKMVSQLPHTWGSISKITLDFGMILLAGVLSALFGIALGSIIRRSLMTLATATVLTVVSLVLVIVIDNEVLRQILNVFSVHSLTLLHEEGKPLWTQANIVGVPASLLLWYVIPLTAGGYRHIRGEVG